MRDRAPWIRVAPGAAAAHTACAGRRAGRIARRTLCVGGLVEPVCAPLVADPGQIGETEGVRRRRRHDWRRREQPVRLRVSPGIARALDAAARRAFPFRFRGQPRAGPRGERHGVVPAHADDRLVGLRELRSRPERGRRRAGRGDVPGELRIRDRRRRDHERVEPDAMHRALAGMAVVPSHRELSRGDVNPAHRLIIMRCGQLARWTRRPRCGRAPSCRGSGQRGEIA